MTIAAEWGTYGGWRGRRDVTSGAEAMSLCVEIQSRPQVGRVLVGFTDSAGRFLAIGLGHELSCVLYQQSADPPYFQSRGSAPSVEPIDFAYDGHFTEMPSSALISHESARQALREYVEAGVRPTCVEWDET